MHIAGLLLTSTVWLNVTQFLVSVLVLSLLSTPNLVIVSLDCADCQSRAKALMS